MSHTIPASEVVPRHRPADELVTVLDDVAASPRAAGTVDMVVARPHDGHRDVLALGTFTVADGLVGDNWRTRGSSRTPDGSADPDAQLTLVNRRWLDHISGGAPRFWPLAGDQVVVDLDLSTSNLAPGDRLRLGSAVVEVTPKPHNGCKKFVTRYGIEAMRMVASEVGRDLRLRGIHVRIVTAGEAGPGDAVTLLPP